LVNKIQHKVNRLKNGQPGVMVLGLYLLFLVTLTGVNCSFF